MDRKVKSVLIIKPSSLGDIVHLFPALSVLQREFPEAGFDFLVAPGFKDILAYAPVKFRRIILFKRKEMGTVKGIVPELLHLATELRREYYDLVIDFQGLLRSAFFAWLTRHRWCIGYSNPTEKLGEVLYNKKFAVPRDLHAVERCVRLACLVSDMEFSGVPELEPIRKIGNVDLSSGNYIAVLPGARWESKRFPVSFFVKLLEKINIKYPGLRFILLGGREDSGICRDITDSLPESLPVLNYAGKTTLTELVEILRGADAVLSNDSGPLHIAAALKKEIFSFFGSTKPELTGPWGGDNIHLYRNAELPCLGCLKRHCSEKCGNDVLACHKIDVEQISQDVVKFLRQSIV